MMTSRFQGAQVIWVLFTKTNTNEEQSQSVAASAWEILSLKSLEVTLEGGCPEEESSSFQLTVLEEQGSFYLFQKLLANIFPCLVDLNWTICPFGLKMVPGYGTWLFFFKQSGHPWS